MNENLQRSLDLGISLCNRFPYGSEMYVKGEKIIAWTCERNREMAEVKTFYPSPIGSLEEQITHDSWLDSVN